MLLYYVAEMGYMDPLAFQHCLVLVFLTAVLALSVGQQAGAPPTGGGLFPPISFSTNFASRTAVSATSTCSFTCMGANCPSQSCNNTCPFGQELPSAFSLLESGTLSAGVMRVSERESMEQLAQEKATPLSDCIMQGGQRPKNHQWSCVPHPIN